MGERLRFLLQPPADFAQVLGPADCGFAPGNENFDVGKAPHITEMVLSSTVAAPAQAKIEDQLAIDSRRRWATSFGLR